MKLIRLYPRRDSAGYNYASAIWGIEGCPALHIFRSSYGWRAAVDLSVEGPIPPWLEELILEGSRSPSGLLELLGERRFGRLSEIRCALEQARLEAAPGPSPLGQALSLEPAGA